MIKPYLNINEELKLTYNIIEIRKIQYLILFVFTHKIIILKCIIGVY